MEYGIFITERMQPMASKSKSIIGGMTVLGIAGIICKLVGVLFSIPLTYVIGHRVRASTMRFSRPTTFC